MKLFGAVILGIVCFVLGFLLYMDIFSTPSIVEKEMGPFLYAYKPFVGPYQKTAPIFMQVHALLQQANVSSSVGLGVYFDDPSLVAADHLHSNCGSVVDAADLEKIKTTGLAFAYLERENSVVVELPLRNRFSLMLGPLKAYPALSKYIRDKTYKLKLSYEVYDMPSRKIFYVMQVEK